MDNFNIEISGELSPFLSGCIGVAIVLFVGGVAACLCLWAASPFLRPWASLSSPCADNPIPPFPNRDPTMSKQTLPAPGPIVTLDEPLQRGEQAITEITLRKPSAGELRGVSLLELAQLDVSALHKVLPRITTPTLTEHDISRLCPADLLAIGAEIAGFFARKDAPSPAA